MLTLQHSTCLGYAQALNPLLFPRFIDYCFRIVYMYSLVTVVSLVYSLHMYTPSPAYDSQMYTPEYCSTHKNSARTSICKRFPFVYTVDHFDTTLPYRTPLPTAPVNFQLLLQCFSQRLHCLRDRPFKFCGGYKFNISG